MEFPPAAQWAKDALAAYRSGPQRRTHSSREPFAFVNDFRSITLEELRVLVLSDLDQIILDYRRQLRDPPPGMDKGHTLHQLANAYRRRWLQLAV